MTEPQDDIFNDDTRDLFREWEERYTGSASSISQAEFFAPADLLANHDNVSPSQCARIEDDGIPLHPSAPRIIISEPDAVESPIPAERPPYSDPNPEPLEQASFPDEGNRLSTLRSSNPSPYGTRSRQRRHSTINILPELQRLNEPRTLIETTQVPPTLRPWITDESHPKNEWRMRTRYAAENPSKAVVDLVVVYFFNSTTIDKLDREADLAIFNHSTSTTSGELQSSPTRTVQRARTDIGKQPSPDVFESISSRQRAPIDPVRSHKQHVNWLKDVDMLPKKLPGVRLLTVGFDIKPALTSDLDLSIAARQLRERIQQHHEENSTAPTIFLGHALGGPLIIKALSDCHSRYTTADNVLSDTAGLFLFSNSACFQDRITELANIYGTKPTDKLFQKLSTSPIVKNMHRAAKDRLAVHYALSGFSIERQAEEKKFKGISICFPIFRVLARGEQEYPSLTSHLGTVVRTIAVDKDPSDVLRYANAEDYDFHHLMTVMQSVVHTHKLLHAAASNRADEIPFMVRRGANVNLRDRWSQTALQIAVRMNHEAVVTKLLSAKNVDPNCRDRLSNTPLHYAVRNGNEAIVRALIHNGADIGLENQRKRTPKDLAEKHRSRKHIAKLLKSRLMSGPDQSLSSKLIGSGKSPSSEEGIVACRNSQITITEIYATRTSDKHWSVNVSVEALLYGPSALDDILDQVRPRAVKQDSPVCIWIHIPENNMVWVEDLFAKLRLHPAVWQDTRSSVTDSLRNRAIIPHFAIGDRQSLFVPYISYEANSRQAKRTSYIQGIDAQHQRHKSTGFSRATSALAALTEGSSRASAGERRPLLQVPEGKDLERRPHLDEDSDSDFSEILEPDDPDDLEEEEKALIKAYLYDPPALHVRRTLDQYYYHMLENTHDRDIDQVVSRWAQNVAQEPRHNILMVDQLWLWMGQNNKAAAPGEAEMDQLRRRDRSPSRTRGRSLDNSKGHYIVSCFPNRTGSNHLSHRTLDDLRLRVLDPNSHRRDPIRQPEDLVSRILELCCSPFDRMQDVQMLRFFQMFEDSVGTIDDKESRLFRDFQRGSNRLLELDNGNKFYNEKKNALLTDLLDIREEISLLVEIKDIRDEVNIILTILNIQRTLVEQMSHAAVEDAAPLLRTPLVRNMILRDVNDFTKLDSQARTIQDKLNTLMDLKQKAANAWEAKEARETAVAAGKQGNTVLVFTVVTIIFLPLSFMSSFFAIGIAAFPHNAESGEVDWPLGTVTGILFGVSLCVSIPLIIFALNMEGFTALYREVRYNYLSELGMRIIPLLPPLGARKDANAYRRRWTGLLEKQREEYMKDDDLVRDADMRYKNDGAEGRASGSFPTTASSRTFVEGVEKVPVSRSEERRRGFRSRRKMEDDESAIGS